MVNIVTEKGEKMEQREKQIQNRKQVILYESKSQLVTAAVDKIVVEIFNKKEKSDMAQLILLTGCSPLAGTTSTCIGLGIAIANTQRRTLLIDCDMRKTVKYKKLNDQVTVGLSDYLSQDGMNPSFDYADVLMKQILKIFHSYLVGQIQTMQRGCCVLPIWKNFWRM